MSDDNDRDENASQRLMAIGELGAGVVHEVRNLVTSIRGFAQVGLRRGDDLTPELREVLETIERESARCVDALSSFLGFARAREAPFAPMDINDAVRLAARLVKHQLALANVRLELELAEDLPRVIGDPGALSQILVNLALNAKHVMPDGGRVVMVSRVSGGSVEVLVCDDGPGVPEELREKIFEPFFTTRPNGTGTGLGLSISWRIAAQHGGTLAVDASSDGGCFVLRLPAVEG